MVCWNGGPPSWWSSLEWRHPQYGHIWARVSAPTAMTRMEHATRRHCAKQIVLLAKRTFSAEAWRLRNGRAQMARAGVFMQCPSSLLFKSVFTQEQ